MDDRQQFLAVRDEARSRVAAAETAVTESRGALDIALEKGRDTAIPRRVLSVATRLRDEAQVALLEVENAIADHYAAADAKRAARLIQAAQAAIDAALVPFDPKKWRIPNAA